jgi:hypothetical protein
VWGVLITNVLTQYAGVLIPMDILVGAHPDAFVIFTHLQQPLGGR